MNIIFAATAVSATDGLNTHPDVRANFGFNARYKQDDPTGHLEFLYSDGHIDLKSSSIEQLVITGGRIVQFKGWASVKLLVTKERDKKAAKRKRRGKQ